MDLSQTLWHSKSNGHKKLILLLICLILLIPSIAGAIIVNSNGHKTLTLIMIIVAAVVIFATIVVLVVAKFTGLKWSVSNLIFAAASDGFYFTGTNNQDSYFFAEWSEIAGYSIANEKNGIATVTLYFSAPADCGIFGRVNFINMVNISGLETLKSVFETYNIKEQPK